MKRIATKYKSSTTSSLHWCGAWGDTGGKLALRAGGRRQCNLSFTCRSYLTKIHARKHDSDAKRFECFQCDKTFAEKKYLTRHHKFHAGQKDHKCTECKKTFVSNGELRLHVRIHTGEKPYKCDQCEKSFSQKHTLNYHTLIHLGDRPFSCARCGNTFLSKGDLTKHMKIHLKENNISYSWINCLPLTCFICCTETCM